MSNIEQPHLYEIDPGEEIVISGIAGRFPKSDSVKELQENLFNKEDLGSADHGRWNNSIFEMSPRIGNVNNLEKFDARFFDIPTGEAHLIDPGARGLLEHTYEAIIDAGVNPKELRGTRTGVFVATCFLSSTCDNIFDKLKIAGKPMLGCMKSMMANRVSYWLGTTGPTYNVDTGCSSSNVAMAEAFRHIRCGKCEAAIVGAVNLCTLPYMNLEFLKLGITSLDGYSRPFDEEANGYMRSEAITVVYLQRAKNARRMYATFVHSKINSDGFKEEGITYPSVEKQKLLLDQFYEELAVSPTELSYLEAHSAGTQVGDLVEIEAIDQAICAKRTSPLLAGSIKSNIGHTEPVSGLCQIIKVMIAMETGIIPPTINFNRPQEKMHAIVEGRLKIVTELTKWEGGYVGVNSFGFGGANCHLLLKSNPKNKINNGAPNDDLPRLVAVSGRTKEAVKTILDDIHNRSIDVEYISLLHYIHNDNIGGHLYRGYSITSEKFTNVINKLECNSDDKPSVCFLFSGLGSQWLGMGQALMKFPEFAKSIQKCEKILNRQGISIVNILTNQNGSIFDDIVNLFVGIAGLQIGMVDVLTSLNIVPDYIIGHSIGEFICGYADGCLTVEETILLAYYSGLALSQSKIIDGTMAEINLDFENVRKMCLSDIDTACYNSKHNCIASGPTDSMKEFLCKLQTMKIFAKEISCAHIPLHSRYLESARVKILKYLNQILPQEKCGSSKWLNTSAHEYCSVSPKICSPEYFANYLLHSVILSDITEFVPKNAVVIEIAPYDVLQLILKTSLRASVINVALSKCGDQRSVDTFLHGIGTLYNAGLQPRIAKLYPEVKFPVSRGTPMISHLVRWEHSEYWYMMRFTGEKSIDKADVDITVNITDEEFVFMTDYVINGKNQFPTTGYLFYLWNIIGWLRKQDYMEIPIVFENLRFLRATLLSRQKSITLNFTIQKGSNRFEISEGEDIVVTGTIRTPVNIEGEKIFSHIQVEDDDNDEEVMNTDDIYKELRLRGYQYSGIFRGLKSASNNGKFGTITWAHNWIAFMENMLQMTILRQNMRNLIVPTRIRKVIIDPSFHTQQIQNIPVKKRQYRVYNYEHLNAIISGGVEIHGAVAKIIPRRQQAIKPVMEEYKFVAHRDLAAISLKDALRMSIHIALECHYTINVKIIEFIEDNDKVIPEELNSPFMNVVLNDIPGITSDIKLITKSAHFQDIISFNNLHITKLNSLPKEKNYLMITCFDILKKNNINLIKKLSSNLIPDGFILTLEELDGIYDYSYLNRYGLHIILEKCTDKKKLVLLRKVQQIEKNWQIVRVNNYEFSWVDKLKMIMNAENSNSNNIRIIVLAEGDPESGLLGLLNCFQREPGGEIIRGVFIQDNKAPTFSLQEQLYSKQLKLDLSVNILRPANVWGSYRHFPLSSMDPKMLQHAYVTQRVQGDPSSLCWIQNKPLFTEHKNYISVIYASINFKDVMLATGRLSSEIFTSVHGDNLLGLEFVGYDSEGQRVMGTCLRGGITNFIAVDNCLTWIIPDQWTMEDAATVPYAYAICYYALYIKGRMKKSDKVLIHSGTGEVGQAAIHLALHESCEIFITVENEEKRQFIRDTFPSIPENHIGNSRDTSFEHMVIQQTNGRGVDIVLNSLAEEKLQASVRCLAKNGRFLEIGVFDMFSDNSLEMSLFLKGVSFHGILLDNLIAAEPIRKQILWNKLTKGIENGAIKPLCRKIFERDEIEDAFRYMATGKHIGKILIRIRKKNEALDSPIPAYSRYYCLEDKCYIILGGLGGVGLELANWLILRGARYLVLTSRSGIKSGYQQSRIKMWQSGGVNVEVLIVPDYLKNEDCENILKRAEERAPVDAIFNLAAVLKDNFFKNQSAQSFEDIFKSKAWATKKMDELSRKICTQLRHFVVFSSFSSGRGYVGQTNYGMANSVMERICESRVKDGLHGLAIQWGAIGQVGIVANMLKDDIEPVIGGTLPQEISSFFNVLEIFLLQDRTIVSSMVVAEKMTFKDDSKSIVETVANIMGFKDMKSVSQHILLYELGTDSIIEVEIKQTLEKQFDIILTPQELRNLNFAKLKEMDEDREGKKECDNKSDEFYSSHFKMLVGSVENSNMISDITVELATKKEVGKNEIFLLPGINGCAKVFNSIASKIKCPATCLQHGALNIPDATRSIKETANSLLPYLLEKIKDQQEFVIVGYSFGSLVAIELARLLEAENLVGRLLLIDGAPDHAKALCGLIYQPDVSLLELENVILLRLMEIYYTTNEETYSDCVYPHLQLSLELDKCKTWEEKLDVCILHMPKEFNVLTTENLKLLTSTIYDHIIAVKDYDVSSLPRIKSSIILLKPTIKSVVMVEDYGLHNITEGKVKIHYVEGTHVTIFENDDIAAILNGELE